MFVRLDKVLLVSSLTEFTNYMLVNVPIRWLVAKVYKPSSILINWRTLMKCLRSTSWFVSHCVNSLSSLASPLGRLLACPKSVDGTANSSQVGRGGFLGILPVYPSNTNDSGLMRCVL